MFSLALDVARWIARRIVWLLIILLVLWAGTMALAQFRNLAALENNVVYLQGRQAELRKNLSQLEDQTKHSVASLTAASETQLSQRIYELDKQIESRNQQLQQLEGLLIKLNPAKYVDVSRLKIEIALMTQELSHLRYLREISSQSNRLGRLAAGCEKIRQQHVAEWKAYQTSDLKVSAITGFQANVNPFSDAFSHKKDAEAERDRHAVNTRNLKSRFDQCESDRAATQQNLARLGKARDFVLKSDQTQAALVELEQNIETIRTEAAKHWMKPILLDPLRQVFPIALLILVSAILLPIAIKLCLYFVLAPVAERQVPICLLPRQDTSKQSDIPEDRSAVSLELEVAPDSELVVKPAYFHSAPSQSITTSRKMLDNRFLMTSLAAGMYNLTAVQSDSPIIATLSSGQESLTELLQLRIDEEDAICIRPRNLVGVIHQRGIPIRISSHWKLGSIQAWLTLQLRYLVFHGPASIIVKGCRGVRVSPASDNRAIEQASTVGFSACIDYSASRTETLMAYLSGHKGLLRDRFNGNRGFYIYEEMPDPSKRSGVTGKCVEGVIDAALKLFGV